MAKLEASEQSLKSLAYLDSLILSDPDKATKIITTTKGEPLVRLVLAALSRITHPIYGFTPSPDGLNDMEKIKAFTDMLVNDNLLFGGENIGPAINVLADNETPAGLQYVFTELLVRYEEEQIALKQTS